MPLHGVVFCVWPTSTIDSKIGEILLKLRFFSFGWICVCLHIHRTSHFVVNCSSLPIWGVRLRACAWNVCVLSLHFRCRTTVVASCASCVPVLEYCVFAYYIIVLCALLSNIFVWWWSVLATRHARNARTALTQANMTKPVRHAVRACTNKRQRIMCVHIIFKLISTKCSMLMSNKVFAVRSLNAMLIRPFCPSALALSPSLRSCSSLVRMYRMQYVCMCNSLCYCVWVRSRTGRLAHHRCWGGCSRWNARYSILYNIMCYNTPARNAFTPCWIDSRNVSLSTVGAHKEHDVPITTRSTALMQRIRRTLQYYSFQDYDTKEFRCPCCGLSNSSMISVP